MTPTTDDAIIESKLSPTLGTPSDLTRAVRKFGGYALTSDDGAMLFIRTAPTIYRVTLSFDLGGQSAKQNINAGFAWMFVNTDATEVNGFIEGTNLACIAMCPHTLGYTLTDAPGGKNYVAKLEPWASAYGVPAAASEMRAVGNDAKADRIEKLP